MALSPDGRLAAVSAYPREFLIRLQDVASGEKLRTLVEVCVGSVSVIAFSPDARLLAISEDTAYKPDVIHLFDVKAGKRIKAITTHKGLIASMAFSPDGKRLATGGWDSTVLIWDLTAQP